MKLSFQTKNVNDKILVTLFANGVKVSSVWKTQENSRYVSLNDLKEQMKLRYVLENYPEGEEEKGE
jgi:hypothetical protein